MDTFWDTGEDFTKFDFEREKKRLFDNLEFLSSMPVEEQTLYKKWVELQDPQMIREKYGRVAKYYDSQWSPIDINDLELTLSEIENMEPYVEIIPSDHPESDKWTFMRKMVSSMSWTANPGRNLKALVKDRTSGKVLGMMSLASDVTSIKVRDAYIGWTKDNKFVDGKLNHTAIGSTFVCTQPLGYNFLGGKLIAMMSTSPVVRDEWKRRYGQTLIGVTTTSLYGIHSQYNGIPQFKTLGESTGKTTAKPDDFIYKPWSDWLKREHFEEFDKAINQTGPKQNILNKVYKYVKLPRDRFHHGFKRGVYFAQLYDNGNEYLRNEITDEQLVPKQRTADGDVAILKWWKRKAIARYKKLHQNDGIKPEFLYYKDAIGISWEEMKSKYLKDVGR